MLTLVAYIQPFSNNMLQFPPYGNMNVNQWGAFNMNGSNVPFPDHFMQGIMQKLNQIQQSQATMAAQVNA